MTSLVSRLGQQKAEHGAPTFNYRFVEGRLPALVGMTALAALGKLIRTAANPENARSLDSWPRDPKESGSRTHCGQSLGMTGVIKRTGIARYVRDDSARSARTQKIYRVTLITNASDRSTSLAGSWAVKSK